MNIFNQIYGGAPLNAEVPTYAAGRYLNDPFYMDASVDYVADV